MSCFRSARCVAISAAVAAVAALAISPDVARAQHHRHQEANVTTATIAIPASIKAEHDEIHAELVATTKAAGRVGDAARALAAVLHPHFVREEEIALPPLGLLAALARGETAAEMREVLPSAPAPAP